MAPAGAAAALAKISSGSMTPSLFVSLQKTVSGPLEATGVVVRLIDVMPKSDSEKSSPEVGHAVAVQILPDLEPPQSASAALKTPSWFELKAASRSRSVCPATP